jgi:hypothetical protein
MARYVSRQMCVTADISHMTITAEHIYNKICEDCDRPALTFDRDNRARCSKHASILVRAQPVKDEIPVLSRTEL